MTRISINLTFFRISKWIYNSYKILTNWSKFIPKELSKNARHENPYQNSSLKTVQKALTNAAVNPMLLFDENKLEVVEDVVAYVLGKASPLVLDADVLSATTEEDEET